MKSILALLMLTSVSAFAYDGPKNPVIPADNGPIRLKFEECLADVQEVVSWDEEEEKKRATRLCELRADHLKARTLVTDGLAKIVSTFKGFYNHDHDQNLPVTIDSIQQTVANCLKALESQQYPHNIALVTTPEYNAILCENVAAQVVQAIVGQ